MRSDLHSRALRSRWTAAATALPLWALSACGGEEAPTTTPAEPAVPAKVATPAPDEAAPPAGALNADAPAPAASEGTDVAPGPVVTMPQSITTLAADVEGEVQYEEGVEKPLVAEFPAETAEVPRPSIEGLPSEDELLGKPLVINEQVVPFDEIKKQVCLAGAGAAEIEQQKLRIFIEEEKKRRSEAGLDAAAVEDDDVQGFVSEIEAELVREYPGGEVGLEDLLAGLASNDPMANLRLQVQFEKLYLPDNPADFPPVTLEAILQQQGGDGLLEHYKTTHEERQKSETPVTKNFAERQFDAAMLQQVHQHLLETAKIEPDPAPGVLFRVNGVDIRMEDVWERIRPLVTTMEVRAAKQWIVNTRLLQAEFEKAGTWLTDEEAAAAYEAHSGPYKDSIFSQERVALVIKQFPSVDRYVHYRRLYESFKRYHQPTEEELAAHAEKRTNKVVGQVAADVDVILCSAFDFKANRWKANGWSDAEKRMKDVLRLLVEEQRPWDELVERYSDYYEPPIPVSQAEQDPERAEKGRFRNIQRNNLLPALGESEYGLFLNGTSITDFIFFEQEVQSLGTPMRGPVGWYLPRLMRRTKPPQRLSMDPETLKTLIQDDYTTTSLNALAQKLVQDNKVYGLEHPDTVVQAASK